MLTTLKYCNVRPITYRPQSRHLLKVTHKKNKYFNESQRPQSINIRLVCDFAFVWITTADDYVISFIWRLPAP